MQYIKYFDSLCSCKLFTKQGMKILTSTILVAQRYEDFVKKMEHWNDKFSMWHHYSQQEHKWQFFIEVRTHLGLDSDNPFFTLRLVGPEHERSDDEVVQLNKALQSYQQLLVRMTPVHPRLDSEILRRVTNKLAGFVDGYIQVPENPLGKGWIKIVFRSPSGGQEAFWIGRWS